MSAITTTGDLRNAIAEMIVKVRDGKCELDDAAAIAKLAGRLNETFFAEISAMKVQKELGQEVAKLGEMAIKHE